MRLPRSTGFAVVEDIEVWRAANQLIQRYGQDAELEAAKRADAMLEAGDIDRQRVWQRILKAVDELLAEEPPLGTTVQ